MPTMASKRIRIEEMGVASPVWTRRAVADLIRHEFHLVLAVHTVGRYLAR